MSLYLVLVLLFGAGHSHLWQTAYLPCEGLYPSICSISPLRALPLHTDYRNNFCLLYNIPWVPEMQAIVFVKEKKSCSLVFRVKCSSVRCGNCVNSSQFSEMLN